MTVFKQGEEGAMLNEWIRSIIIFTIFFSLVLYLVPNDKYKKHVQTVTGFVMIIVVITPVLELLSLDKKLALQYDYSAIGNFVMNDEGRYYQDMMEETVRSYLRERYGIEYDVVLVLDTEFHILRMELYERETVGSIDVPMEREKIISEISREYGMSVDDIFIY